MKHFYDDFMPFCALSEALLTTHSSNNGKGQLEHSLLQNIKHKSASEWGQNAWFKGAAFPEVVASIKLFWLRSAVSVYEGAPQFRAGRATSPAGHARPRSWLWTACTFCTDLEAVHQRSASHATGGRGRGTGPEPPADYCEDTFCRGGRPHRPSL